MAEVKYRIVGKDDSKKAVKSATKGMKGMEKAAKSLGKVFSLAMVGVALVAVKKLSAGINKLTDSYYEQEAAEKKLQAALRATGNSLGITQKEMHKTASEMQKMTTYGDEAVIAAQALMVTFTQIGKDVFPEAIEAAADMSTMFGQDLQQSVVQLGAALNDPITGIGRLQRIGVAFTESQKESIKTFVEQNDILSAQTVILDELKNEFGGVARAMGQTRQGIAAQFKAQVGDIGQQVGEIFSALKTNMFKALSPVLDNISAWFTKNGPKIYAVFTNIVPIIKMTFDLVVTIIRNAFKPENFMTTLARFGEAILIAITTSFETVPMVFMAVMDSLRDIVLQVGPAIGKMLVKTIFSFTEESFGAKMGEWLKGFKIGGKSVFGTNFGFEAGNSLLFGGQSMEDLQAELDAGWQEASGRIDARFRQTSDRVFENIVTTLEAYGGAIEDTVSLSNDEIEAYQAALSSLLTESMQEFESLKEDTTPIGGGGDGGGTGTTTTDILAEIAEIIPSMYEQMKQDTKDQAAYMEDVIHTYYKVSGEVKAATLKGDGEQLKTLVPMLKELKKILGITEDIKEEARRAYSFRRDAMYNQSGASRTGRTGGMGGDVIQGPGRGMPFEVLGAFGQIIESISTKFGAMFMSLSSVVAIMDPLQIILTALMDTIGPLINEALKPVIGFLSILGQTLGKLLIPIIQALAPFIEQALKQFIWLYNVLVPVLNILYKFLLTVKYVLSVLRTIGTNIGIWFYNLVHRKAKHKAYEELPGEPDLKKNYFEKIDLEDVYASGDQATGGGGGGASYTSGRDITINVEINTDVLVGDRRSLAIWIAEEIKELEDLGLAV